ncbi:unnamed protein product, partial [Linum tenue]
MIHGPMYHGAYCAHLTAFDRGNRNRSDDSSSGESMSTDQPLRSIKENLKNVMLYLLQVCGGLYIGARGARF